MRGKGAGRGPEPKRKGVGDCMVRTWKDVRLEANVRGELNAREDEGGHLQLVLRWEGCEEGRPPQLTLAWSQPLVDMQFAWHPRCGFDRSLRVDWAAVPLTPIGMLKKAAVSLLLALMLTLTCAAALAACASAPST